MPEAPLIARTRAQDEAPFAPVDYGLYAVTVMAWSFSWYALSLQPGVVANEVSIAYRFALAAAIMLVWALASGRRMRFAAREHAAFAAMGVLIFSTNFLFFYYGSSFLVSGLLSVVFSLASLTNVFVAALAYREWPSTRTVAAGAIGFAGIALMFWPKITEGGFDTDVARGLALCITGTLCFSVGSLISSRLSRRRAEIPLVSANAWGMVYGAAWCAVLALIMGKPFGWDPRPEYLFALVFLAVVSTVIAFAAYLTLVGRIGSGRAGYATVIFPIFALLVSTVLEGYEWTFTAFGGLALVIAGNVMVMRGR
ncbi:MULTISPECIES: DMT family transporter [unclassified Roseitalea]|uniref:DMT family transporter n=1 Tax=unclassified Roseitalea TaxID=2639107 RepID=UPI00273E9133|nr:MULTISPECIES: DMT family transporter [unclassified Roseitalea]